MDIEAVDSINVEAIEYQEPALNTHPNWNGRYATSSSMGNISQQTHVLSQTLLVNVASSEPRCLKGSVGGSAGADTEGNADVEVHVQGSNEEGNISYEVKGTITLDSEGNTNAEVRGGFSYDF